MKDISSSTGSDHVSTLLSSRFTIIIVSEITTVIVLANSPYCHLVYRSVFTHTDVTRKEETDVRFLIGNGCSLS